MKNQIIYFVLLGVFVLAACTQEPNTRSATIPENLRVENSISATEQKLEQIPRGHPLMELILSNDPAKEDWSSYDKFYKTSVIDELESGYAYNLVALTIIKMEACSNFYNEVNQADLLYYLNEIEKVPLPPTDMVMRFLETLDIGQKEKVEHAILVRDKWNAHIERGGKGMEGILAEGYSYLSNLINMSAY